MTKVIAIADKDQIFVIIRHLKNALIKKDAQFNNILKRKSKNINLIDTPRCWIDLKNFLNFLISKASNYRF